MRKPYGRSERLADARPSIGRPCKKGGRMRLTTGMALVLLVVAGLLGSCATAPASREDKAALVAAATSRLQQMSTADPALRVLIQQGYGYAIFPNVDKGGLGVGGAYGQGVVYEQGQHIGYSDLTQGSEPSPHPGTRSLRKDQTACPMCTLPLSRQIVLCWDSRTIQVHFPLGPVADQYPDQLGSSTLTSYGKTLIWPIIPGRAGLRRLCSHCGYGEVCPLVVPSATGYAITACFRPASALPASY
jgi:hypothetical protein